MNDAVLSGFFSFLIIMVGFVLGYLYRKFSERDIKSRISETIKELEEQSNERKKNWERDKWKEISYYPTEIQSSIDLLRYLLNGKPNEK